MKFYQVLPSAPGFLYISPAPNRWEFDLVAWAFEYGSAVPIPVTVEGPQPRKGASIRNTEREHSQVNL